MLVFPEKDVAFPMYFQRYRELKRRGHGEQINENKRP